LSWIARSSRSASADLEDAADWYEQQAEGLRERFLDDFAATRERIAANPNQFPHAYRDARRASLRRFPYIVIFRVRGEEVHILAVFHTRRDPRRWQRRVR
jgi:plasmid stabilization system protein ParE